MAFTYKITKTFTFEASHKLNLDYPSACSKFHGHSYNVEISIISDKLDTNGMVMDFSKLGPIKTWVDENWDHAVIMSDSDPSLEKYMEDKNFNLYIIEQVNVTAELMCKDLLGQIETLIQEMDDPLPENIRGIDVTIWETGNNKATISGTY